MLNGELSLNTWLLGEPLFQVQVVAFGNHDVLLHPGILSESVHVCADCGHCVRDVKSVPGMLPWTVFKQNQSFENWVAMNVDVHWVVASDEVLSVKVP